MSHPNEASVRAAYQAFSAGDIEAVSGFMADDTEWHLDNLGILSGDYKGRDEVVGFLGRLMEETEGTFVAAVHDVVANDEHAVALVTVSGSRKGETMSSQQTAVFHMRDGKSTEAWFLYADGAEVNRIFS